MVVQVVDPLIGDTPTVHVVDIGKASIWCKLEFMNATASIKDRSALAMLNAANLEEGSSVIEPSTGNLVVALARLCSMTGLKYTAVVSNRLSDFNRSRLERWEAKIVVGEDSMPETFRRVTQEHMASSDEEYHWLDQYTNRHNVLCHQITGQEILEQVPEITHFVAGTNSGGTLMGCASVLKPRGVQIIGATAANDPRGEGTWVPPIVDENLIDGGYRFPKIESQKFSDDLARRFGIEAGFSTGAAWAAAVGVARTNQDQDVNIVFIATDRGFGSRAR